MKNAKALLMVSLMALSGLAFADECCQENCSVEMSVDASEVVKKDACKLTCNSTCAQADKTEGVEQVDGEIKG